MRAALGAGAARAAQLRAVAAALLTQPDFDRLLWACDLNFVRGEDSLVRAQWAGAPFVWQIYPQHDGAHRAKLEAFLDRLPGRRAGAGRRAARAVARLERPARRRPRCRDAAAWRRRTADLARRACAAQPDLASQLLGFVARNALELRALRDGDRLRAQRHRSPASTERSTATRKSP